MYVRERKIENSWSVEWFNGFTLNRCILFVCVSLCVLQYTWLHCNCSVFCELTIFFVALSVCMLNRVESALLIRNFVCMPFTMLYQMLQARPIIFQAFCQTLKANEIKWTTLTTFTIENSYDSKRWTSWNEQHHINFNKNTEYSVNMKN